MTESISPQPRARAQQQEQSAERQSNSAAETDASEAWRSISRAIWQEGEMTAASMPDISKQNLNEMLGLGTSQSDRRNYRNPDAMEPSGTRSLIDWNALAAGKTITINPLPERPVTGPGPRQPGLDLPATRLADTRNSNDRSRLATTMDFNAGGGKRLLEPVQDQAILAKVPDAMYIGQRGTVTTTRNRGGEAQDYWLSGSAAQAFARAQEMLAAKGKQIIVSDKNGAGRTVDTQTEIYTRSRNGRGFAAGRPTESNHTRGNAMDVSNWQDPDVKKALLANGWRQGDSRGPIKNDLHHFSYAGPQAQDTSGPPRRQRHRH
ncbi:MAG: M15 family metallopeptidase [Candidatus Obscuribacterales bacterium]|nr:M15 family metallopeptidase [Candidatus Obscuribacterales bacterium]